MAGFLLLLSVGTLQTPPMSTEIEFDRITDQVRAVATLRAGDDRLDVGCTPNEVRRVWVRLRSHRWFREGNVFNGNISFAIRFDNRRAQRMMWSVHERTALLVGRGRVLRFVRQLLEARQLIVRAPGPERRHYDIVFAVEGAREAITGALEACGGPFRALD